MNPFSIKDCLYSDKIPEIKKLSDISKSPGSRFKKEISNIHSFLTEAIKFYLHDPQKLNKEQKKTINTNIASWNIKVKNCNETSLIIIIVDKFLKIFSSKFSFKYEMILLLPIENEDAKELCSRTSVEKPAQNNIEPLTIDQK